MSSSRESSEERDEKICLSFPKFVDQTDRLKSFSRWPKRLKKSPELLSHVGFFYSGCGEQVTCFSCGVLWTTNESYPKGADTWEAHAILSNTKCTYVTMAKGSEFSKSAWVEHYERWLKAYNARKKREKQKADREEKRMKEKQAEEEMN